VGGGRKALNLVALALQTRCATACGTPQPRKLGGDASVRFGRPDAILHARDAALGKVARPSVTVWNPRSGESNHLAGCSAGEEALVGRACWELAIVRRNRWGEFNRKVGLPAWDAAI
jgi:hypothetical protein